MAGSRDPTCYSTVSAAAALTAVTSSCRIQLETSHQRKTSPPVCGVWWRPHHGLWTSTVVRHWLFFGWSFAASHIWIRRFFPSHQTMASSAGLWLSQSNTRISLRVRLLAWIRDLEWASCQRDTSVSEDRCPRIMMLPPPCLTVETLFRKVPF